MDATHQILESLIHYWNEFLAQVPALLAAILVIAVGILFANYLASLTRRALSPRMNDPLMTNFLSKSIKTVLVLLVIILAMKVAGLDGIVTGLITAAGASAIIVGFAFRDIGENFIAGLILSFNRPFDMNDTVLIGDLFGRIKTMEFRYTKMKTFDGRDVYIPNADVIKKPVINYTEDGFFRLDFIVGIAYEDNYDEAEMLVLEVVRQCEGVIDEPGHECYIALDELAASTVNLRIFFWVSTLDYRKEAIKIKSSVMARVKTAIEDAGYNMPADIKEIKLYGSQQSIPVQVIGGGVK